jgi:RND family efflux transporter MFP subunit
MTRTHFVAAWFAGIAAAALLAGCGHHGSTPSAPQSVYGLATAQVASQQVPTGTNAVGSLHAPETAILSAQVSARVVAVLVKEGDSVAAGQTLIKLDAAQFGADVNRAEASVSASRNAMNAAQADASLADSTLARYQVLRDKKSVSPQEFDQVEQRAKSAHAMLDAAKAQLAAAEAGASGSRAVASYTRITAPFSGRVTTRMVDPGTLASPGVPLLIVDKSGPLELHVILDESLLSSIRAKMQLPVQLGSGTAPAITGTVASILPSVDSASHTFEVKIAIPQADGLRAGMYGSALIANGTHAAALIPQIAVVSHGSMHSLWVLDANRIASLRYVTLGLTHGDQVEALSGITPGETVVLNPGDRELGGARIETGSKVTP